MKLKSSEPNLTEIEDYNNLESHSHKKQIRGALLTILITISLVLILNSLDYIL